MWKKIGNCSFCGKDLGHGINYQYIRDGFICSACRVKVYGYAVEELNYLSFEEIAKIIDEHKKYTEYPELKMIPVRYFRGYPMHGENKYH